LPSILLEIVASTVDDCIAGETGGADRIELCAAVATGGLTPSLGILIEAKKRLRIPVLAMIRPRAGGFCYSEADCAAMQCDAALLLEHGADGIVFGSLRPDGSVDTTRCSTMLHIAGRRQTVFHRAFDVVPDPVRSLEELIDLGVSRVLTSGQQKTALAGSDLIRQLITQAGGRAEILPGGGVRAHNVQQLVEATRCTQVHMTALAAQIDPSTSNSVLNFGGTPDAPASSYEHVDLEIVRRMRRTLDAITEAGSTKP